VIDSTRRAMRDLLGGRTSVASDAGAHERERGLSGVLIEHWQMSGVLLAFVASMFIVPTLEPVAIGDDWVYARSVERLIEEGRLELLPIASANLVFQIVWGAVFALFIDPTLGALRLSTAVLWLLSGLACYGICLELNGNRATSALGGAVYLFNPIGYVLAFTFMTDAPFTALLVIATYGYIRGLYPRVRATEDGVDDPDGEQPAIPDDEHREVTRWVVLGSIAAAGAVLVRQPGVLVPLSVAAALLLERRLWPPMRGVALLMQVGGIPLVAWLALNAWLSATGVPEVQTLMLTELRESTLEELAAHALLMSWIEPAYLGLFVLPLVAGAVIAVPVLLRSLTTPRLIAFVAWEGLVIAGTVLVWQAGMRMPYIPHYFSAAGLGPNDLEVGRDAILGEDGRSLITAACAITALLGGLILIGSPPRPGARRRGVTLVAVGLATHAVAAVLVSVHFRGWTIDGLPAPSLDRYLLPLLPLTIALIAWGLRGLRVPSDLGWIWVTAIAVFAVVGTRDNIVFHREAWALATRASEAGVPLLELDGGASWDGYYLGEYSYEQVGLAEESGRQWWLVLFAPVIDPRYVVSTTPVEGYEVALEHPYDLWLDTRPVQLYLLRREDAPWPPAP
jgi:hypothetical protein